MINKTDISSLINKTITDWQIPGCAVAIVDGEDTFTEGFGLRAVNQPELVDADTIFAIGSTSKAFTSAVAGILVDEGKLAWDDPVVKYLPDFELYDPWVTKNVTLRDLLCHRVGLERVQRIYYHQEIDQHEIIRRMRYLNPAAGFRTQFHYANQNYGAVGLIIEAVSGQSWDEFLAARVFDKLGMSRSSSGYDRLVDQKNLASPHASLDEAYPAGVRFLGEKSALPWFKLSHEPSGSILTTANDLVLWIKALIAGGSPILSSRVFDEITSPQIVMQKPEDSELSVLYYPHPDIHFWTYGLGWWVMDYRGYEVLMHGGQMPGFNSMVAFFPELKKGFAVMLNVHQTLAHASLFLSLSDLLMGKTGRDWDQDLLQLARGYMTQVKTETDKQLALRKADTRPSAGLEQFAGQYENDKLGAMTVDLENNELIMHYGKIFAVLQHWENDTFLAKWNLKGLLGDMLVSFDAKAGTLTTLNDRMEYKKSK